MKVNRIAGLDGLRFISISCVVLLHLFTFKDNFGYSLYYFPILETIGGLYAVQFFFVVSGFLLTFLLLNELSQFKEISIKAFYRRRVLRIWPAYYLLIIIAMVVALYKPMLELPDTTDFYISNNPTRSNIAFLLFLPHISPFLNSTAPFVHHTYTIGIEEQFYVLWGLLFFSFKHKVVRTFVIILIALLLLNILHELLYQYTSANKNSPHFIVLIKQALFYLKYSRISTFSIGALFGYAFFAKKKWVQYFKLKWVQMLFYAVLVTSILFNPKIYYFTYEYVACLIACLIIIATFEKESIINFNTKWLSFLGKISYGIYLFHMFAIYFSIKLLKDILNMPFNNLWHLVLLCLTTLAISIFFGWASYFFFERYFLKLKLHYKRT